MEEGFWGNLPKGFVVLGPMEGVTDAVFRQMVGSLGKPDVSFTEFTSVEGMVSQAGSDEEVRAKWRTNGVLQRLFYAESERPIVAQIWGRDPEKFAAAARIIKDLGFDGVDINFGCPVREVVNKGAGAAMIERGRWGQVAEIIAAVREGTGGLPVSVKTRIGVKKVVTQEWVEFLLSLGLAAITVHGRTVAEKSKVAAHWEEIGKAVEVGRAEGGETLIVGNGDVRSRKEAEEKVREYGVDGVMIARGVLEDPWVFGKGMNENRGRQERLGLLKKHLRLWEEAWEGAKSFSNFKKYVKVYIRDFAGAGELRGQLMAARAAKEMLEILG